MKICIDAGHGGKDPGAVSENVQEKDINLVIATILFERLSNAGHEVVMTRTDDSFVKLYKRVDIANNAEVDVFISIHNNAAGNTDIGGTEVLHYPDSEDGIKIAGEVQKELVKLLRRDDRGLKERDNLVVLNSTTMPAILVECGFLTNPIERKLLQDKCFQELAAIAIMEGLEKWEIYLKED